MKASREPKRLFVGGLGHSVSEADLQQQFGRFGEVSDVEIITRKDDQGNPQKVFAYINIQVAEADLKKCMSVLNKTKWKGGTLQIQLAKESFLHRLAQEREEAKAKKEESARGNSSLLEKKASMDFQGKGVPGTEVPGHKNWVVSKFGRVLPILHLKNQQKRKIIKYDPSKYCHNLKKIGEDFTSTVPVSNLTWEMEGGDDPMSKKRRGEFSDFHGPPRKMIKTQKAGGSNGFTTLRPEPSLLTKSSHFVQQKTTQKTLHDSVTSPSPQISCSNNNTQKKPKNLYLVNSGLEMPANRNSMSDDTDSEDELRLMIAREENLPRTMKSYANESENDSFEVVKDDFKSDIQNLGSFTDLGIRNDNGKASDCGYDSGDTDEIITKKKTAGKVKSDKKMLQRECFQRKIFSKECELSDHHNKKTTPTPIRKDHQKRNNSIAQALSQGVRLPACESPSNCSGSDVTDSKSESETSTGEEEYAAMMKNCLRVNLTLADLQEMAGRDSETPREGAQGNSQETTTARNRPSKGPKTASGGRRGQRCVNPEEIVASLLEESSYAVQKPKENNFKPKFQAFKGIGCLYEKHSENKSLKESVATNSSINKESLKLEGPSDIPLERVSSSANGSQSSVAPFQQTKKANDLDHTRPLKKQPMSQSQNLKTVSSSCSVKGTDSPAAGPQANRKSLSSGAKTPRPDFDKGCCQRTAEIGGRAEKTHCLNNGTAPERSPVHSCKRDAQESKTHPLPCATRSPDVSATHKQADDNQKRLAALEARQKAKEAQKKLVHDALANLDGPAEAKPSHIIFGSDSESEVAEAPSPPKQTHSGEEPAKKALGKTSGKLFDSSADEESASEDDEERFRIKPQFEGRAGQKLMNLQSHFGTDERFRLDSRFLESESEEEQEEVNERKSAEDEELAAEKLKTLNVMQSVLQISLNNATSKSSVTAKKFKDVIRYDPTRQDHATYERKTEDKPKESKAKRKKKREEAEKLPEVSKEMYYNVAKDLKEIFQSTRDISEKEEISPCNEGTDGESAEEGQDPAALTGETEQSTGFTFSFFDSDTEEVKKDTYRIETVKPGKMAWQGASRFQDSSSSEEEDGTEDAEDEKPSAVETSVPEKETTRFFFFSKTDERLQGSDLFWRGVGNDISQSSWEARTRSLHMDCRKKHKDAKRRVKTK